MSLMRTYRRALGLSQSAFAAQLNVPLETYRPWDAGRREPPPQLLTRARTLAGYPDDTVLLPLPVLALMIGVHVRTLHAAARSGRLGVAYDTRTTFRRLRPRATLKHALDFRRHYYGTQRRPPATPVPLTWASRWPYSSAAPRRSRHANRRPRKNRSYRRRHPLSPVRGRRRPPRSA